MKNPVKKLRRFFKGPFWRYELAQLLFTRWGLVLWFLFTVAIGFLFGYADDNLLRR